MLDFNSFQTYLVPLSLEFTKHSVQTYLVPLSLECTKHSVQTYIVPLSLECTKHSVQIYIVPLSLECTKHSVQTYIVPLSLECIELCLDLFSCSTQSKVQVFRPIQFHLVQSTLNTVLRPFQFYLVWSALNSVQTGSVLLSLEWIKQHSDLFSSTQSGVKTNIARNNAFRVSTLLIINKYIFLGKIWQFVQIQRKQNPS